MFANSTDIIKTAENLLQSCGSRDPYKIAEFLDITIMESNFTKQKGAFSVICGNNFILVKNDLHPAIKNMVLLHEIGHYCLHRKELTKNSVSPEFSIFDTKDIRMEYEANIFASHISLPDDEIIECIELGFNINQIAMKMNTDVNLVALKTDYLIKNGYLLNKFSHENDFLK